jgi:hypothetical protein
MYWPGTYYPRPLLLRGLVAYPRTHCPPVGSPLSAQGVRPIELVWQLGRHHAEGDRHETSGKGGADEDVADRRWRRQWRGDGPAMVCLCL